jgi:hypothetical protein
MRQSPYSKAWLSAVTLLIGVALFVILYTLINPMPSWMIFIPFLCWIISMIIALGANCPTCKKSVMKHGWYYLFFPEGRCSKCGTDLTKKIP